MRRYLLIFLLLQLFLVGVFVVSAHWSVVQADTVELVNPLKNVEGGVTEPGQLVVAALKGFAAILAFIAIAFAVFSGFKLIIATGEEAIETAKKSLTWAVGGFIVAISAFAIIAGTANFLGFKSPPPGQQTIENPVDIGDKIKSRSFVEVMYFVMRNFLGIVGVATILMIVYYGYMYISSMGNEEAIEKAKNGLKWSILGFVITLLAFTLISSIQTAFFK